MRHGLNLEQIRKVIVCHSLERTGAQDISSTGEASSDQGKSDKPVQLRREVA